jgi:hypothetical protein
MMNQSDSLDSFVMLSSKDRRMSSEGSPRQGVRFTASSFVTSLRSAIHITNAPTKYRLIHGSEFRELLDARDIVLEHGFNIIINCEQTEIKAANFSFL